MANPFGELIDNDRLDQMLEDVQTQENKARVAMRLINDRRKNADAFNYVQSVRDHYGNGVSALCLVYNGTGDTVHYVADHDWYGYIGRTPYPVEIGNGQWGAFLHVHRTSAASGSQAAVVYRGKNQDGNDRDYLIAWNVPWGPWYSNTAYCEVGGVNSFQSRWGVIEQKLNNSKNRHTTTADGCRLVVDIGGGTSPVFRAELSIPYNL